MSASPLSVDELQQPIIFHPVYKNAIWGGTRVREVLGRETDRARIAESWEVSDRDDGMSVVAAGPLAGATLRELVTRGGADLLGTAVEGDRFPLLIKIIDASATLSIQVHPNDETAARYGGEAKSEMWYALAGEPESVIYHGTVPGTDEGTLREAMDGGEVEALMCTQHLERGDAIYVPGGLVHAIGAGLLLLEVQQNSNTTYRVDDWGRIGDDGKPRELHVEQAMQVIDWQPGPAPVRAPAAAVDRAVLDTPYFHIHELHVTEAREMSNDGSSFDMFYVRDGSLRVAGPGFDETYAAATTILLPACLSAYTLTPTGASSTVIRIRATDPV